MLKTMLITMLLLPSGLYEPYKEMGWSSRVQPTMDVCKKRAQYANDHYKTFRKPDDPDLVWMCAFSDAPVTDG